MAVGNQGIRAIRVACFLWMQSIRSWASSPSSAPKWGIEIFMVRRHVSMVQEWTQHHGVLQYMGYGRM